MNYKIVSSGKFKRDLKIAIKRGYDMTLLDEIVTMLAAGKPLPEKNRDHALKGEYAGCRECHVTSDWLLIYAIRNDMLEL